MKQVVLNIKEGKYRFFMELVKSLDFVQVEKNEGDSKEEIVANLKQSFKELKLYKEGKLEARNAEDLINEL
jgi:predicted transposase YdaD